MRASSPGARTTSSFRRRVRVEGFFSRMWLRMARRRRSLPVPVALLRGLAVLFGRGAQAQRVLGSLQVDIGKTRELLGWQPPVSIDQALAETARWYREARA